MSKDHHSNTTPVMMCFHPLFHQPNVRPHTERSHIVTRIRSIVMPVVRPEIQSKMSTLSSWHARFCILELHWFIVASGHTLLCSRARCKEGPSKASPRKFAIDLFWQEVEIIFGDTRKHDIGVQILTDVSVLLHHALEGNSRCEKTGRGNCWLLHP